MTDSEQVMWQGEKKSLGSVATGGRVVTARYRITAEMIYFDAGLISSTSEQIPLWAVRDVDVKQSLVQKPRNVGDVHVRCQHSDYTGRSEVVLESVEGPKAVRDLLNQLSTAARAAYQQRSQTVHYAAADAVSSAPSSSESVGAPLVGGASFDLADQLKKLADLRDAGVLTEGEFQTQKQKLLA